MMRRKMIGNRYSTKTIRLFALDFYEVIVDEAEGGINYHLMEIESELIKLLISICYSVRALRRLFFVSSSTTKSETHQSTRRHGTSEIIVL